MLGLFGGGGGSGGSRGSKSELMQRHSSGWKELLKQLETRESLRVLDVGPTSSANINFITSLGHSIYMANLVEEAAKPEWMTGGSPGEAPVFDLARFVPANLNFSGRIFDVVLLWDTIDYLPPAVVSPLFDRLYKVIEPGGVLLAFFHSKATGVPGIETSLFRYHLTTSEVVAMQPVPGNHPLTAVYSNRQVENLLHQFSGFRFFLAKDNLREVIATR